jgi:hypothetical protein
MSVVGNLSRHNNLSELAEPRDFPTYQSVATRQAEAVANLGLPAIVAGVDTIVAHIDDPTGGATVDAEARAAIVLILDALEAAGLVAAA